jgi:hypothetical protein
LRLKHGTDKKLNGTLAQGFLYRQLNLVAELDGTAG